jgi:tripartite-type tricarboxylate transporter receptor subunit TctC
MEFAKTDEQKKIVSLIVATETIGRPLFAPPGTPADRVALLRKALMDVVKDPEFLADAEKAQLEISPVPGEKLQALVENLVSTPADIVEKYKRAVSRKSE